MQNGVMLQGFHWESVEDGTLWRSLGARADEFAKRGFSAIWLPPATKGAGGGFDVGYGVYDLFDLGEFDQKGSVRTKYGTKDEFLACVAALRAAGLQAVGDVVLNHRMGADAEEDVEVVSIPFDDRLAEAGEPFTGRFWTRFDFPGRGDTYSAFKWNQEHFVGIAHNEESTEIFLKAGKGFAADVDDEFGNFDYLMGADVDLHHPDVREELFRWGRWFLDLTDLDGFRLDAVKHMSSAFVCDFMKTMRAHRGDKDLFAVAEYWVMDVDALLAYIQATEEVTRLFDVPLHRTLHQASEEGDGFDLSSVFAGSLVATRPDLAVTFVDNHDTQPGQSLASWVKDWFKPHAYALTLLRAEGYPVVFAGDYDGGEVEGDGPEMTRHRKLLDRLLDIRERFNHGDQTDYFDHPNCVAWLRSGDDEHPGAMVVVMSNGETGSKVVETNRPGETFFSVLSDGDGPVVTAGDDGRAEFSCPAGTVAIWVSDANGEERWGRS